MANREADMIDSAHTADSPGDPTTRDAGVSPAVVVVHDVSCGYGDRVVLEHVSFEVRRSEIFAVLGGSGSGKTTLLRHLTGRLAPISGSIRVFDVDVTRAGESDIRALSRRFGVLYQGGALFGNMTVGANVALPLHEFTDLPDDVIREIVRMKLRLVGLDNAENLYPAELSGGMRKRAGLARAMALDPDLLFFDEPSSGLDPILAAEIDRLILTLRDVLGTTMVVVTHDLDSVLAIADRVILLSGKERGVIAEGDPRTLAAEGGSREVRDFFTRCGLRKSAPGAGAPSHGGGASVREA